MEPYPPKVIACADRYCVSGLTVEREGDVCAECRTDSARYADAEEDAHTRELARAGREWNQMCGGF